MVAAIAASRPTGDRSTSTSVTQPNSAGWSLGETPSPAQSRRRRDSVVGDHLRREGGEQHRPRAQLRRHGPGGGEHGNRAHGVPRVRHGRDNAVRMALAAQVLRQRAEHHPRRHEERHRAERQEEEHRHEHDLRGDREAVADREAHLRQERVGGHQGQRKRHVEGTPGGHQNGQEHGDDEERGGGGRLDGELAAAQRVGVGPVPGLAELLHGRGEPGAEVLENPHRCGVYRHMRATPLWTFVRWTDVAPANGRMSVAKRVAMPDGGCMSNRLLRTLFAAAAATAAFAVGRAGRQRRAARGLGPDCRPKPTHAGRSRLGETANYKLAPGGSFEGGAGPGALGRASMVSGNEPWKVHARADKRSLKLPPGATATSPVMCVGIEHPTLRLLREEQPRAALHAHRRGHHGDLARAEGARSVGVLLPSGQWKPSPKLSVVANLLPLLPGEHTPVQFRVRSVGPRDLVRRRLLRRPPLPLGS